MRFVGNITIVALLLIGICPLIASGQLPLEPSKQTGQNVTAAYEGWFRNADGTFTLLVGYFNRNHEQTLEIPIGPDNRLHRHPFTASRISSLTCISAVKG